jgi:hypothetical protein
MNNQKSVSVPAPSQVPAYLADRPAEGIEHVGEYQQTPRVKVLQAQAMREKTRELQETFGPGAVIIMPDELLVAEFGRPWHVVPLFFWPSWARWSDLNDTAGEGLILETQDPNHALARLARNPETREQPYEDNPRFRYRNVENLNFACAIQDGPASGAIAVFTFTRGSHAVGRSLCGYLKRRGVAIYANRLRMETKHVPNVVGQMYYRIEFRGADEPFLDPADIERTAALHADLKRAFEASQLGVAQGHEDG